MKRALILATTAATVLSMANVAQAQRSSDSEFRGYSECVDAAERQSRGLVTARNYFINKEGANADYFINATRWQDGVREEIRIACQTAARGQRLVSAEISQGVFRNNPTTSVRVEVAQK